LAPRASAGKAPQISTQADGILLLVASRDLESREGGERNLAVIPEVACGYAQHSRIPLLEHVGEDIRVKQCSIRGSRSNSYARAETVSIDQRSGHAIGTIGATGWRHDLRDFLELQEINLAPGASNNQSPEAAFSVNLSGATAV
jgi:hypothetical protein